MKPLFRSLWVSLSLALLSAASAQAQTFYEVNYIDPDDQKEYTGLMIYYDDEHCQLRLVNDELLVKDQIYESNYVQATADKESRDDVGVMAYCPEEDNFPAFLWMWEKDDASDISEKPFITFDPDDEDSYFEANYFTEITLRDMDEEYISQFYGEEEPEYQMMLRGLHSVRPTHGIFSPLPGGSEVTAPVADPAAAPITTPAVTGRGKFRMMVIANTWVSDIGVACKRDLDNLRSEFSAIARVLGMEYDEQVIEAGNYDKPSAVKMIKGAEAGPDDVLMFVYTGHGFRWDDQTDYYPNIDLTSSSYDDIKKSYVAMSDIYDELTSKGARLTIVLSDCCNSQIGSDTPLANVNSLFSRTNSNFDLAKLQTLFLGSSGVVRATASSPGQVSWCGVNGGFFLLSFIESLRTQISPLQSSAPSWEGLINNAIESARKKSIAGTNSKEQNGLHQVSTRAISFHATPAAPAPEPNVAPGQGGSTLDI